MKAYQIDEPGSLEALRLVERDRPSPGPGQVLVRVRAASLNYRDLAVVRGKYRMGPMAPNLVPLSDGAGEVAEVGPGVTRAAVGDRVMGAFMQRWIGGRMTREATESALGGAVHGVLAEYAVLHEDGLVAVPGHLSFEEAATLPCAAVTAWHCLAEFGQLRAGQTVLTLGTGGVSVFAMQFAAAMGARVVATSSSGAKLERARAEFGAAAGVNYRERPDWDAAVLEATDGAGADVTVEVGGAGTLARSLQATAPGGRIGVIGILTRPEGVDPTPILARALALQGIYVGSRQMFEAMNLAIARHRIRPVIDRVFAFDEAREAYRHLAEARHVGKVVIAV